MLRLGNSALVAIVLGALLPSLPFGVSGVFRSAYTEVGGSNPTGLVVGDFNGDRRCHNQRWHDHERAGRVDAQDRVAVAHRIFVRR